jgi:purine-binding chemotaxis protein CheW
VSGAALSRRRTGGFSVSTATLTTERNGKYLVFQLGREEFGVHVLKVREIMGLQEITAVPQTPLFVKGVINLRGKVVPVIDLRAKFGLEEAAYTQRTCIVVLEVAAANRHVMMGAIVDGVSEVLNVQDNEIEDPPDFGAGAKVPFVRGLAKVKGKVKILLDIDKALSLEDLSGFSMDLAGSM